jgi:hypothetical protein
MSTGPSRPLSSFVLACISLAVGLDPQRAGAASAMEDGARSGIVTQAEPAAKSFGVVVGPEMGQSAYHVGPRASAYVLGWRTSIAPSLRPDVGGRASFAFHELQRSAGLLGASYVGEALPVARVSYLARNGLEPYAEYGIGVAWMRFTKSDSQSPTEGGQVPVLHCGIGFNLAVSATLGLLAEVRAHVYPKRGSALFVAVPSLGVEWR